MILFGSSSFSLAVLSSTDSSRSRLAAAAATTAAVLTVAAAAADVTIGDFSRLRSIFFVRFAPSSGVTARFDCGDSKAALFSPDLSTGIAAATAESEDFCAASTLSVEVFAVPTFARLFARSSSLVADSSDVVVDISVSRFCFRFSKSLQLFFFHNSVIKINVTNFAADSPSYAPDAREQHAQIALDHRCFCIAVAELKINIT